MAFFISPGAPALVVPVAGQRAVVFRNAEYRTTDLAEIAALRADPRVWEAGRVQPAPRVRPWAVNLETGALHYVPRAGTRCHIPAEVDAATYAAEGEAPEGWRVYRRESDAKRWNRTATQCSYCGGHGDV